MASTFLNCSLSIWAASTLTTDSPIMVSLCFTIPAIMVPSGNATSMESAASTALSGVRTRISVRVLAMTTPENCPDVSMGLSNQSFSC